MSLDHHMSKPGAQSDWRGAAARSTNQSCGQAFHGIEPRYRTALERALIYLVGLLLCGGIWAYLIWAYAANSSHLS